MGQRIVCCVSLYEVMQTHFHAGRILSIGHVCRGELNLFLFG